MPENAEQPQIEHRFPCENCGSDLRFSPKIGGLTCDHCGYVEEQFPRQPAIRELDFQAAIESELPELEIEEKRVTSCSNCGAHVDFDETNHATECPFCAAPVVIDTGLQRQIKPKGVIPFKIEEAAAQKAMSDWLGRLWFAPNGLKEYARKGRKMQGIYVPFWTFDAHTKSQYTGRRGTEYRTTSTHVVDGKKVQKTVTKVRWTSVKGRVGRFFDDVLVLASAALPKKFTQALEPWDLSEIEPFQTYYLSGFRAEGYSINLSDGFTIAREKMDRQINRDVKFDIGGDRQQVTHIDTSVSNVKFKHILLPVWLAAYKYRGKTYRFVINGQTARVEGERPYSTLKIASALIIGIILAATMGYIYANAG